jgi:hypothetical protein
MDEDALAAALARNGLLDPKPKVEPSTEPYVVPDVEADVVKALADVKAGIKPVFNPDLPDGLKERDAFLAEAFQKGSFQ